MSRTTPRRTPLSVFFTRIQKHFALVAVLATVGVVTAACDVHGVSEPGTVASIVVTPNATLAAAGTQQMTAVGLDAEGRTVTITPTWSVANGGGTVAQTGVFTAGAVTGVFANTVVATVGTLSGNATITVTPGPLASIQVVPNPVTLAVTGTQLFVAVGRDAGGNIVQFTPTWSVVAGGGTIAQTGLFTAGALAGTYTNTVQASNQGMTAFATVVVTVGPLATLTLTPNPATLVVGAVQQFVAVGRDAAGNLVTIAPTWSVTAAGGTIDGAGRFTAGATPGTFTNTVRVSTGALSATATVIVTAGPLATITVTPNPASVTINGIQQFTAVGSDIGGNPVAITPIWSVVASGGTINAATGLFTAGTLPGTFTNTVRATSGGLSGTATVVVTTGPLATITVTPNPVFMLAGSTQQFVAVGRDASNNVFIMTPVWSVVNGGGSINASGLFTAGAVAGPFLNTVQATSGAISGTATVTVNPVPVLTTITVTPNPGTMLPGVTQLFTAVGRDQFGTVIPFVPVWSVVAGGGAINGGTGLFTAGAVAGTFLNTVRAASGAIAGTATVTITPVPALATITVTPNPASVLSGATQQFTAVGRDQFANIFPFVPVWSVVNGGGAINGGTGLFTAGGVAGTFLNTVQAAGGAITGTATVTVTGVPVLTTIIVSPNPASVASGGTQQFTAVGRDQFANVFPFVPVWSVVNGGGAINGGTGLFTAGGVLGTFTNTVRAASGLVSGTATVNVGLDLGAAAPNGIMAGQAVTCVTGGIINADVSISPGNTITGFGPCVITGTQNLANGPALAAQNALTTAYNTLAGLPCPPANAIVANLGGTTLLPGVYCTASGIGVTGVVTLNGNGDPNAVFVFQAGTSLVTAGNVVLINGAAARNVYWQVGTSATLGTGSQWQGNILALTSISLIDAATLTGRALARNGSVTLTTANLITLP
jgi:hypothetical protein